MKRVLWTLSLGGLAIAGILTASNILWQAHSGQLLSKHQSKTTPSAISAQSSFQKSISNN